VLEQKSMCTRYSRSLLQAFLVLPTRRISLERGLQQDGRLFASLFQCPLLPRRLCLLQEAGLLVLGKHFALQQVESILLMMYCCWRERLFSSGLWPFRDVFIVSITSSSWTLSQSLDSEPRWIFSASHIERNAKWKYPYFVPIGGTVSPSPLTVK